LPTVHDLSKLKTRIFKEFGYSIIKIVLDVGVWSYFAKEKIIKTRIFLMIEKLMLLPEEMAKQLAKIDFIGPFILRLSFGWQAFKN
tara:strand:+ start:69 stop:326 length:258 start_codon:yes stop_codon:yes gene_type:complete